jgi:hypothetical protein
MAVFAIGLEACAKKPTPQDSCNFVQNSDMQRVSWGSQTPVIMYIDRSVPGRYNDAIRMAADSWNKSVGHEVIKIGGTTDEGEQSLPNGTNVIYFQHEWDGTATEQARTTIFWSGNRIYEAHIKINNRDFKFFAGDNPVIGNLDMQSLILHEFGHVLGLKHAPTTPPSPQSVMVPTLSGATALDVNAAFRRIPSDFDTASVACEY